MDHEDSDRVRFGNHLKAVVDDFDCDDEVQMLQNLDLTKKLAEQFHYKRGREELLRMLQEFEVDRRGEFQHRNVIEALFQLLDLQVVESGHNCGGAVVASDCQFKYYPLRAPTIPETYIYSPFRSEEEWYNLYLQHSICKAAYFLDDLEARQKVTRAMMYLVLFKKHKFTMEETGKRLRQIGINIDDNVKVQNAKVGSVTNK